MLYLSFSYIISGDNISQLAFCMKLERSKLNIKFNLKLRNIKTFYFRSLFLYSIAVGQISASIRQMTPKCRLHFALMAIMLLSAKIPCFSLIPSSCIDLKHTRLGQWHRKKGEASCLLLYSPLNLEAQCPSPSFA